MCFPIGSYSFPILHNIIYQGNKKENKQDMLMDKNSQYVDERAHMLPDKLRDGLLGGLTNSET